MTFQPVIAVTTTTPPQTPPEDAVEAAQARYDATRSHKALVKLQEARFAQLKAEVRRA